MTYELAMDEPSPELIPHPTLIVRHNFSPHFYPIYLEHYGHFRYHGEGIGGVTEGREMSENWPGHSQLVTKLAEVLITGMNAQRGISSSSSRGSNASGGSGVDSPLSMSSTYDLPDVAMWTSVVQILAQLVLAGALHWDLPGCMLMQTMTFVALNKVSYRSTVL